MPPTAGDFRTALRGRFDRATEEGKTSVEVRSGHLREDVGGYPGSNHRMRNCCRVMRSEMIEGDVEVDAPPKGDGASVVIRGLSRRTLDGYRVSGDGPAFHRFGNRVRYCRSDLDAWAAKRRATTTAEADRLGAR